jgi:hypothetical protein
VKVLELNGAVGGNAERRQHAALDACAVTVTIEIRGELVAQRRAVSGEPVIGRGNPASRRQVTAGSLQVQSSSRVARGR